MLLELSGKVIEGLTKFEYVIFFFHFDSMDRKTAILKCFAFAVCILVASLLLLEISQGTLKCGEVPLLPCIEDQPAHCHGPSP